MTVDWVSFTPWSALIGGVMIGLAAALLVVFNGRIAGISGMLGGLLTPRQAGNAERFLFVLGLLLAPLIYWVVHSRPTMVIEAGPVALVVAGLLVGFGSRLGSGCTSGHGVCGLARLSLRGFVATLAFMGAGFVSVFLLRHVWGG
ncbi:YeeE/YedE family protein [Halopseudomonas laoshanensis]|uniref:YeeE/YedE family protein n=1 Tax=Halopseudomonas laoshanensis TaxID=2268758 RepID=A0A7V7KX37_9GAMM|nr:YeeE/YedE thiosulfate transporter family protein [Halopseudomonas laoshanensis]KAA0694095.1 YeeE/YedE family protein [Halopseudomonas laoshanensis]